MPTLSRNKPGMKGLINLVTSPWETRLKVPSEAQPCLIPSDSKPYQRHMKSAKTPLKVAPVPLATPAARPCYAEEQATAESEG